MNMLFTLVTLPRMSSGVRSWLMALRKTKLTVLAAPAIVADFTHQTVEVQQLITRFRGDLHEINCCDEFNLKIEFRRKKPRIRQYPPRQPPTDPTVPAFTCDTPVAGVENGRFEKERAQDRSWRLNACPAESIRLTTRDRFYPTRTVR